MRTNHDLVSETFTFILAGGEGRRLSPLTRYRPKPLVPFGGCHRLVDFTLSNCLNSGLKRACILTQHESDSISSYIKKGWRRFGSGEFVRTSAPAAGKRFAGTADAVLQNLSLLERRDCKFVLVLSADHVYRMDYRKLLSFHAGSRADATIATVLYPREFSSEVGVLDVDECDRVVGFEEKPQYRALDLQPSGPNTNGSRIYANMGVYVFNLEVLLAAKAGNARVVDFAHDVIPRLIRQHDVCAYRHEDQKTRMPLYWRDVGTPEAYYATSMALLGSAPSMDLYDSAWPIRSADSAQFDGPSGLSEAGRRFEINSIIARGVNIGRASVYKSVLFPGVVLGHGVQVRNSVLMPGVVIEHGAAVNRAIIDANVVIGAGDNIGHNRQRDLRRFHVAPNGVVVVSPDHLSPFFNRDVIHSVRMPATL